MHCDLDVFGFWMPVWTDLGAHEIILRGWRTFSVPSSIRLVFKDESKEFGPQRLFGYTQNALWSSCLFPRCWPSQTHQPATPNDTFTGSATFSSTFSWPFTCLPGVYGVWLWLEALRLQSPPKRKGQYNATLTFHEVNQKNLVVLNVYLGNKKMHCDLDVFGFWMQVWTDLGAHEIILRGWRTFPVPSSIRLVFKDESKEFGPQRLLGYTQNALWSSCLFPRCWPSQTHQPATPNDTFTGSATFSSTFSWPFTCLPGVYGVWLWLEALRLQSPPKRKG